MPILRRFVLGFCFDFGYHHVLLIEKNRPPWQAGKLNGIGGKIDQGESPVAAMAREFREETGGLEPIFTPYGRLVGSALPEDNAEVWLFHAKIDAFSPELNGKEIDGEILYAVDRDDVVNWSVVPNVRVLMPMALNHARRQDAAQFLEIRELAASPVEELLGIVPPATAEQLPVVDSQSASSDPIGFNIDDYKGYPGRSK